MPKWLLACAFMATWRMAWSKQHRGEPLSALRPLRGAHRGAICAMAAAEDREVELKKSRKSEKECDSLHAVSVSAVFDRSTLGGTSC